MSSLRQIEANRANSEHSTGPRTRAGKMRSRRNALRHGLTARRAIIDGLEDAAEHCFFESMIVAEYEPRSILEHELTVHLASLLWRLRRVTVIETGLFRIQNEIHSAMREERLAGSKQSDGRFVKIFAVRCGGWSDVDGSARGK
jgi:hypothetical protein